MLDEAILWTMKLPVENFDSETDTENPKKKMDEKGNYC